MNKYMNGGPSLSLYTINLYNLIDPSSKTYSDSNLLGLTKRHGVFLLSALLSVSQRKGKMDVEKMRDESL